MRLGQVDAYLHRETDLGRKEGRRERRGGERMWGERMWGERRRGERRGGEESEENGSLSCLNSPKLIWDSVNVPSLYNSLFTLKWPSLRWWFPEKSGYKVLNRQLWNCYNKLIPWLVNASWLSSLQIACCHWSGYGQNYLWQKVTWKQQDTRV